MKLATSHISDSTGTRSGNCAPSKAASIYIIKRLDMSSERAGDSNFAGNGVTVYEYGGSSAKDGHRQDGFDLAGPRSVNLNREQIGFGFRYNSPDKLLKDAPRLSDGRELLGYDYDQTAIAKGGKDLCVGGGTTPPPPTGGTCNGLGTCTQMSADNCPDMACWDGCRADSDCLIRGFDRGPCGIRKCSDGVTPCTSDAQCTGISGTSGGNSCPNPGPGLCMDAIKVCYSSADCVGIGDGGCRGTTCNPTTTTTTKSQYPCTQSMYSEGNFVIGLYSGNQTNDTNQFCQFFTQGVDDLVSQTILDNGKEIIDFYVWPVIP